MPGTPNLARQCFADPFKRSDKVDPNLYLVPPPEPFSLLLPLVDIAAGDIKRPVGEGFQWEVVDAGEIGYKTPSQGIAFARVQVPELYRLALGNERLTPGDQVWLTSWGQWRDLRFFHDYEGLMASAGEPGMTIGEIAASQLQLKNEQLFVAKPDGKQLVDHRVVNVPPRHRALFPREKLRRGDKIIYEGLQEWEPIAEAALGQGVQFPDANNGNVRYARPVSPNQQNWYVDETQQPNPDPKYKPLGGRGDPWVSLTVAVQEIEQAATAAGVPVYGIIWRVDGTPLSVYDLPEEQFTAPPPLVEPAEPVEAIVETPAADVPTMDQNLMRRVVEARAAENAAVLEQAAQEADRPQTMPSHIREMLQEEDQKFLKAVNVSDQVIRALPPDYRLLSGAEELFASDVMWGPINGNPDWPGWQPVSPVLYGARVDMTEGFFARRTVVKQVSEAERKLEQIAAKIELSQQHLDELTGMFEDVKRILQIGK